MSNSDDRHIDIEDDQAIASLARGLGVTPEQLRKIIAVTGPDRQAVEQHIRSGHGEAG